MPSSELDISCPRDDDEYQRFAALAGRALLVPDQVLPRLVAQEGLENVRVARRDGGLAGGLSVQRMGQWFGGRSVPVGAVRMVATAPEFRGQGVATALLDAAHRELHAAGVALGALYPATHVLYRRAGYELAGSRTQYRLPTHALPQARATATVNAAAITSKDPFVTAATERARLSNGPLDRSDWLWGRVLTPFRDPLEAYTTDGGHVIFSAGHISGGMEGGIIVKDIVALTPSAALALLQLLRAHATMVDRITFAGAPGDPLFCLLDNPSYRVADRADWMLRLIDVERALDRRGYADGVSGEIHLDVRDDTLEWNHGRFVLEVTDGKARVSKGGRGDVAIDVRGLAAAYAGFLAPAQLVACGYVSGDAAALARLGALFAGPAPWMPDGF